MRGGSRPIFWYQGKEGLPSVTIEVHVKTLLIYIDKGQKIVARTGEEALQLGWQAIYQAKDKFLSKQELFSVHIETDTAGIQIGKCHLGLIGRDNGPMAPIKAQQDLIDQEKVMERENPVWFDRSVEKELGAGHIEMEMFEDHPLMFPAERTIQTIADLPETIKAAMPEAMQELGKIGPLTSEVHQVLAHIQGGLPIQNQVDQLTIMMAKSIEKYNQIIDMLAAPKVAVRKKVLFRRQA